jgi:2OG-Fe(II) oxygenase superfamily
MHVDVEWRTEPFGHTVIDGMWDEDRLLRAAAEFPEPYDPAWIVYSEDHERGKQEGSDPVSWGPDTASMLGSMIALAPEWAKLIGAEELAGDTNGGGMHLTGPHGRLAMHRDFSYHPITDLERRLNLLVFLNPEWQREWGGVLYLGEEREVEVLPVLNRTVVFECSERSWHGHPDPIAGEHWRKSLACYFYSTTHDAPHHGTAWL